MKLGRDAKLLLGVVVALVLAIAAWRLFPPVEDCSKGGFICTRIIKFDLAAPPGSDQGATRSDRKSTH